MYLVGLGGVKKLHRSQPLDGDSDILASFYNGYHVFCQTKCTLYAGKVHVKGSKAHMLISEITMLSMSWEKRSETDALEQKNIKSIYDNLTLDLLFHPLQLC